MRDYISDYGTDPFDSIAGINNSVTFKQAKKRFAKEPKVELVALSFSRAGLVLL